MCLVFVFSRLRVLPPASPGPRHTFRMNSQNSFAGLYSLSPQKLDSTVGFSWDSELTEEAHSGERKACFTSLENISLRQGSLNYPF